MVHVLKTLLKHYYVTGGDFKRFVTFWKRLFSDSVANGKLTIVAK